MAELTIHSFNVNGIRAALKKGFGDYIDLHAPDIVCLQETKISDADVPHLEFPYPHQFWQSAEKKGYSGTAILSRFAPEQVTTGLPDAPGHPQEGRVQTADFGDFFLVNVYVPNSKRELLRLPYRQLEFDPDFRAHLTALAAQKPTFVCGDFNVAHQEIDLANPKSNRRNAGFTDEERENFTALLEAGFIDTFRHFYPEQTAAYSWWSYRAGARARNIGWRIDYFLASQGAAGWLTDAGILSEIPGSDHCPVFLKIRPTR